MKNIVLYLILFGSLFIISCNKSSDPTGNDNNDKKKLLLENLQLQKSVGDKFIELEKLIGRNQAVDSAVNLFLSNTKLVMFAVAEESGITVEYKSGTYGGLFIGHIDTEKKGGNNSNKNNYIFGTSRHNNNITNINILPSKFTTIFLAPNYDGWPYADDYVYSQFSQAVIKAGYNSPVYLKNTAVTLDILKTLGNYGIIHISSHGYLNSALKTGPDVFVKTGEIIDDINLDKYVDDIFDVNIICLYETNKKTNYFWAGSDFIKINNKFDGSNFFYAGFCFSALGTWQSLCGSPGLGSYIGYDWSVLVSKDTAWSSHFYRYMSDTTKPPVQVNNWMTNTPDIQKSYFDSWDNRNVTVKSYGAADMKFWEKLTIQSINPSYGQPLSQVFIYGYGFGANKGSSYVQFNGVSANTTYWTDNQITAIVPASATSGDVIVYVGKFQSNKYPFTVGTQDTSAIAQIKGSKFINCEIREIIGEKNFNWLYSMTFLNYTNPTTYSQISWNGNNFSTTFEYKPTPSDANSLARYIINGTISNDGNSISFNASSYLANSQSGGINEEFGRLNAVNILHSNTNPLNFSFSGTSTVAAAVTKIEYYRRQNGVTYDSMYSVKYDGWQMTPKISVTFTK